MITHRLGIDVDGVLANFVDAYRRHLVAVTGRDMFFGPPLSWDFDYDAGYTKAERDLTLTGLHTLVGFWTSLDALDGAVTFLDALRKVALSLPADVYFLTNRHGWAKSETEKWLSLHGYPRATVLVTVDGEKAAVAKALNLTALLDDKPSNLDGLPAGCRGILRRATYNTHAWNTYEGIDHLHEFFDKGLAR